MTVEDLMEAVADDTKAQINIVSREKEITAE